MHITGGGPSACGMEQDWNPAVQCMCRVSLAILHTGLDRKRITSQPTKLPSTKPETESLARIQTKGNGRLVWRVSPRPKTLETRKRGARQKNWSMKKYNKVASGPKRRPAKTTIGKAAPMAAPINLGRSRVEKHQHTRPASHEGTQRLGVVGSSSRNKLVGTRNSVPHPAHRAASSVF